MKKVLLLLAAAASVFAACQKDESPTTLKLTPENVVIGNTLKTEALVVVDNTAKTIAVTLSYEDKAELNALKVSFKNLESGFTAEAFTYNFTSGSKDVAFTSGSTTLTYKMTASAEKPEPKFTSLKVNGVDVVDGTVKLPSTADLGQAVVTFTVSPASTVVKININTVESGAKVDFSDKVNGVDFKLTCEDVTETVNVKAVTTGISKITRLWGSYGVGKAGDILTTHNERNIAMDDSYIYLPNAGGAKVRAISLSDYSVKELSVDGISGGTHVTSGARVMTNGASTVLLVHNLAIGNATGASKLKVYAYYTPDSKPATVLEYTVPNGVRLGDKMTVTGDWVNGELLFFDYANSTDRKVYRFSVTNGVINATPTITSLGAVVTGNSIAGLYKYSDTEYAWSGTAKTVTVFSVAGGVFTSKYVGDSKKYTAPAHDLTFFTLNEESYMASVALRNSFADGTLRITYLSDKTLEESLKNADTTTDKVLGLGSESGEQVTANPKDVNGTGGLALRTIKGKIYIAALASNIGVVLFTVE